MRVLTQRIRLPTFAALLLATLAVSAADRYYGEWSYQQDCGQLRTAGLLLGQEDGEIQGIWHDGTSAREAGGLLKARMQDGKLFLRFCTEGIEGSGIACPVYGEESAYLERQGERLVWYRAIGDDYVRHLELHPAASGWQMPVDRNCIAQ